MFTKKKKNQVLCIGSTSIDIFFPTDEGIIIDTPEDITSKQKLAFELGGKILAPEIHTEIGGVAANVSQGLAKLGINSFCYSCVGKDDNGKFCLETLQAHQVSTRYVKVLEEARTDISAIIVLMPLGERTIIHNRDANKKLIVHGADLKTNWVFVSALNGEWQKNIEIIIETQKHQREPFKIAYNPVQHNIKEDGLLVLQLVRQSEILVLNKDEAIELMLKKHADCEKSVLENEVSLIKMLHQAGAKKVGLTDGIRGAWASDGTEIWHLPTRKNITVIDSTGAGDGFTSGFFGALLTEQSLDEALRYAMANGESVVRFYGGYAGLKTQSELLEDITHLIPQKIL